jgi:hypothetical protein
VGLGKWRRGREVSAAACRALPWSPWTCRRAPDGWLDPRQALWPYGQEYDNGNLLASCREKGRVVSVCRPQRRRNTRKERAERDGSLGHGESQARQAWAHDVWPSMVVIIQTRGRKGTVVLGLGLVWF